MTNQTISSQQFIIELEKRIARLEREMKLLKEDLAQVERDRSAALRGYPGYD